MAGLRRDARRCREQHKSEQIRTALGIETPKEKEKRELREAEKREKARKERTKGNQLPFFEEEDP